MSLAKKLNLKEGMKLRVLGKPRDVDLDDVTTTTSAKEGVLIFVKTIAEVDSKCAPLVEAAKQDRIAWVAYPKAGQLDTDLNRDILWKHLERQGIEGVRQVALDSVWSVMRFRPGSGETPRAKAVPKSPPAKKGAKAGARTGARTSPKADKPSSIDAYIAAAPEDVQAILEKVRKTIRKVLPRADEKISYGMPTLMLDERNAVYFAAWKHHIGLYPVYRSNDPIEKELAPYRDAKDTLKFPLNAPIPYALIERVVAFLQKRRAEAAK
ncbi:DUF1801 domain-containing protein [Archangium violaceum]|uniref:iron chaperone n=1 Tax=Archangium violaceum TaxID=83451 RepID=UPI002B324E9E|nr:DUF1801 domain-containing protein [Archangium gephyra]